MRKKKLQIPKKDCFFCSEFTFEEFTIEQVKKCAEHWLDAEKCSNWDPADIYVETKRSYRLITIGEKGKNEHDVKVK